MRNDLQFTRATPEHVDLLLVMMQEFYIFDHHKFVEQKAKDAVLNFLSTERWGYAWLIYMNAQPIGYVAITFGYSLEFGGRDAFIDEVYLREPYRGMGIGSEIIDYLKGVCKTDGIRALHLEVGSENKAAVQFYLKVGFEDRQSRLMSLVV
jgi:GNAT superfamily N-acetyltransferase